LQGKQIGEHLVEHHFGRIAPLTRNHEVEVNGMLSMHEKNIPNNCDNGIALWHLPSMGS
jgi:hypothetical protein